MTLPVKASSSLRTTVTLAGWRVMAFVAHILPRRAIGPVTTIAGRCSRLFAKSARAMAARHQLRIEPRRSPAEVQQLVDDVFARYTHYWIESLRLPRLSQSRVETGIKVEGYEHVTAGLNAGRGVILALPHLGGWEWAGRWLACRSIEVVAVAERLEPEELFAWMTELRNDLGMTVVPLDSSAGSAVLAALRRNAVVCLLCDRDLQGGGAEVEFFGERTTIPAGPAALALRTGATLLPTAVLHTDRGEGHLGLVLPPLDTARDERPLRTAISDVSNELAAALESLIRQAPTQWHLLQPNWPSDT